ncbi:DeoR/GlpR family DNA-binding transcription regulator [Agrococcus versicolor]|uniref:DeoR/GlpR family DNA-binding transcription regulator n=1 Tax=Agrococcus versicolor TaxID=501482 RepID=A0ABN3AIL9_9MICO
MQRSQRQRSIIRAVVSGRRSIDDLRALTGASAITIRRDLAELAEVGALARVRGGAEPVAHRGSGFPFALRAGEHGDDKAALAAAAAALVPDDASVLVDNGTTAVAVARALAGRSIRALALSLHAAAALGARPGAEVRVPGGTIVHDDLSFAGVGALQAVRETRFDVAILGACAADPDSGLTVAGWDDAQVKREAMLRSRRVVLVVTPDKLARTSTHRFGAIADVDVLVTTDAAPADLLHAIADAGVEVVTVASSA